MKRTSVWVPLAAAGVQLAALALCAWAMQNGRQRKALARQQPRQALAVAEAVAAPAAAAPAAAAPEPAAPAAAERSPAAGAAAPFPAPAAAPQATVVPPSPVTTGPRERGIPRFIINFADEDTQVVAADAGDGEIVFGIFSDGNIRCVDVDNGCYAGKAEGPRARMREVAGSRAFTVQMEPAADDRFEAIFVGGLHDAQRLVLVPLTESGRA
jgi:hypothetical protein